MERIGKDVGEKNEIAGRAKVREMARLVSLTSKNHCFLGRSV
jgi:hypothetical protein